ncbi:unnamed protein product [Notodromas monacha]|uniref:Uncharacterized protein n=1 Tax=Notodromas monacha TaxID=399045 RepID=A0A7R9BJ91_9CRUS|nr:unnamed protein product [Notodromas monacha]CAG0915757.1 unnamed protein product [Notodromas monacha]
MMWGESAEITAELLLRQFSVPGPLFLDPRYSRLLHRRTSSVSEPLTEEKYDEDDQAWQVISDREENRFITQEGHKLEVQPRPPMAVTNAVSWRSEGIRYRKNEVFLDVIESVNLMANANGNVLRSEIVGCIKMRVYLTGMPELRLGLNDKVLFESTGRGKSKSVELEDVKFHQCVRLSRFENDRTISFIPPDGEFELMSYRLNTHVKPLIWIESVIERHAHSRVEYMIKAKSQFKRRSTANNVEIDIPVPADADSPKFKTSIGTVKYGGKEYLMRAHFGLPSVESEEQEGRPPIAVKFEIPYFTTSGIQVRYLKIIEKSGYQALPWRLLAENPCKHPIIVMKGVKREELRALVEFMYKGELCVGQSDLHSLLKTAESLQIRGLSEYSFSGEDPPETEMNMEDVAKEGSVLDTIRQVPLRRTLKKPHKEGYSSLPGQPHAKRRNSASSSSSSPVNQSSTASSLSNGDPVDPGAASDIKLNVSSSTAVEVSGGNGGAVSPTAHSTDSGDNTLPDSISSAVKAERTTYAQDSPQNLTIEKDRQQEPGSPCSPMTETSPVFPQSVTDGPSTQLNGPVGVPSTSSPPFMLPQDAVWPPPEGVCGPPHTLFSPTNRLYADQLRQQFTQNVSFDVMYRFLRDRSKDGEGYHHCVFCGKQIRDASNFKKHLRTHTGEKPYQCRVCGRAFSRSENLKMHLRNRHPNAVLGVQASTSAATPSSPPLRVTPPFPARSPSNLSPPSA